MDETRRVDREYIALTGVKCELSRLGKLLREYLYINLATSCVNKSFNVNICSLL